MRLQPDTLAAIRDRNRRALDEICELAEQGITRRWRMHIPAEPDRDSDLVISRALSDLDTVIEGMHEAEAEALTLAKQNTHLRAALAARRRFPNARLVLSSLRARRRNGERG